MVSNRQSQTEGADIGASGMAIARAPSAAEVKGSDHRSSTANDVSESGNEMERELSSFAEASTAVSNAPSSSSSRANSIGAKRTVNVPGTPDVEESGCRWTISAGGGSAGGNETARGMSIPPPAESPLRAAVGGLLAGQTVNVCVSETGGGPTTGTRPGPTRVFASGSLGVSVNSGEKCEQIVGDSEWQVVRNKSAKRYKLIGQKGCAPTTKW